MQIQGSGVDEGGAGVVVIAELRTEADGRGPVQHEIGGSGDPRLDDDRVVLIVVEEQVGAGTRERVRQVRSGERDVAARVGDEADVEGERGSRGESNRAGSAARGVAQRVQGHRAAQAAVGVIGDVAGVIQGTREVAVERTGGEATEGVAHRYHAEGITVGREGRSVGDGPAADQSVHKGTLGEVRAVDAGQEDTGGRGQALVAQGIGPRMIIRGPTVEIDAAAAAGATDEISDRERDRAAHVHVRQRVDDIGTRLDRDGIERQSGVRRTRAVDREGAAAQEDRVGRGEADRIEDRIISEIVPVELAVIQLQAGRARDGAGILQAQRAATDDGLPGITAGVGEREGIAARTDQRDVTGDRPGESGIRGSRRDGERDDRRARICDGSALTRLVIDGVKDADGLRAIAQVHQRIESVQAERAERGGLGRHHGEGVRRPGKQVQRAAVHRRRSREVGLTVQVHHARSGLHQAGRPAERVGRIHIEHARADDVDIRGGAGRRRLQGADVDVGGHAAPDEEGRGVGK